MIDLHGKAVYLSGPITNNDLVEVKKSFNSLHNLVNKLGVRSVHNPIYFLTPSSELSLDKQGIWEFYMKQSLKNLVQCDIIVLMDRYHSSKGARLEKYVAEQLGIEVIYEKDLHEAKINI